MYSAKFKIMINNTEVEVTLSDDDLNTLHQKMFSLIKLPSQLPSMPQSQLPKEDAPTCPFHNRKLKPSKHNPGHWFCPSKDSTGEWCAYEGAME